MSAGPLLALETSSPKLGVALFAPPNLSIERPITDGAKRGAALALAMQEILASQNLKPKQLGALAVSTGPGSWTGLRIGIAAAKTMAWALGVPLVGVPSFEPLAETALRQAPQGASPRVVLCVRHAYSEGTYAALYKEGPAGAEAVLPECILRANDFPAWLGVYAKEKLILCGEARSVLDLRPQAEAGGWQVLDTLEEVPALAVAQCAWRRLEAGRAWTTKPEIHAAGPLYLRKSDPELKLERRTPVSS